MDYDESDQKPVIPDWIAKSGWLKAEEEPVFSRSTDRSDIQRELQNPDGETNPVPESADLSISGQNLPDSSENDSQSDLPIQKEETGSLVEKTEPIPDNEIPVTTPPELFIPDDAVNKNEDLLELPDWLKNYAPGLGAAEDSSLEQNQEIHIEDEEPVSTTSQLMNEEMILPPHLPVEDTVVDEAPENEKDATVSTEEVEVFSPSSAIPTTESITEPPLVVPVVETQENDEQQTVPEIVESTDETKFEIPVITVETIINHIHNGDFGHLALLAREYELSDQPIDELITKVKEESEDLGERNEYWRFLGDLLDHNGQFDESIDAFRKAETILLK